MASMVAELTLDSVLNQIGPGFSEADARAIVYLGPEASIYAILNLAKPVDDCHPPGRDDALPAGHDSRSDSGCLQLPPAYPLA